MKKIKIVSLIAIALVAVMLLSSCGMGSVGVKKLLDDEAEPVDITAVLNGSYQIADLTGADFEEKSGDIAYFTASSDVGTSVYTKHILYNVETGSFIFTATESRTKDITVEIDTTYDGIDYFTVTTHTWQLNDDVKKPGSDSYMTELFTGNGIELAETYTEEEARCLFDIVYFNGACYRADEDEVLSYVFDYSPLAEIPAISGKYNDMYYEFSESAITVYNDDLEQLSVYYLPSYIEEDFTSVILENGNVLVQYAYLADQYSDEYDLMDETGEKYVLETKIIDAKKGTDKDVDTDYYYYRLNNMQLYIDMYGEDTFAGINYDDYKVVGFAYLIENKHMPQSMLGREFRYVSVGKDGKAKEFKPFNGEQIVNISFAEQNRWVVRTLNHEYLIDSDGEIIGDISNATFMADFIICNGKIYDYDLNEIYDYRSNRYTIYENTESAIIFKDADGDYVLFTYIDAVSTSKIVDTIDVTTLLTPPYRIQNMGKVEDRFFVVNETNVKATGAEYIYKVYNENGMSIAQFDYSVSKVCESDSAVIVSGVNDDGKTVFYRFS